MKESVADVKVEIPQEEAAAEAGPGPPGSRTRQRAVLTACCKTRQLPTPNGPRVANSQCFWRLEFGARDASWELTDYFITLLNSLTSASGQRTYDHAGAPLDPYVAPDSPEADESGHYPRSCWIERIVVERDGLEILHRHI